jgi:dehydrogenase/reductase SDR family protein 1
VTDAKPLDGKVAVVTGGSRGIGKGAAIALGELGATVYVTGRTVTAAMLPGTVAETAEQVTAAGGRGVAVPCDHHDDGQVEALFRQVEDEQGRLDVLVNNVYNSPDLAQWLGRRFWELPIQAWDEVVDIGTRSHYVAAVFAAQRMVPAGSGVIVNVSSSGAVQYAHNVPYGVGKAAVDRMTADMAHDLEGTGVSVVSIWPGLVRTELVMFGAKDGKLALPGEGEFDVMKAQSPLFVGRAAAALAVAPDVHERTGKAFHVADLARDYGFTEDDGSVPDEQLRPESR